MPSCVWPHVRSRVERQASAARPATFANCATSPSYDAAASAETACVVNMQSDELDATTRPRSGDSRRAASVAKDAQSGKLARAEAHFMVVARQSPTAVVRVCSLRVECIMCCSWAGKAPSGRGGGASTRRPVEWQMTGACSNGRQAGVKAEAARMTAGKASGIAQSLEVSPWICKKARLEIDLRRAALVRSRALRSQYPSDVSSPAPEAGPTSSAVSKQATVDHSPYSAPQSLALLRLLRLLPRPFRP